MKHRVGPQPAVLIRSHANLHQVKTLGARKVSKKIHQEEGKDGKGGEKGTANYLQAWFSNCTCGSRSLRSLLFSLLFGIPLQVPLQLFKCRLHDLSMQIYNILVKRETEPIRTWSSTLLDISKLNTEQNHGAKLEKVHVLCTW